MSSLRRTAARSIQWTAVSGGFAALVQLIQVALLARLLSPADFGLAAMASVVVGFAQAYADMGFSNALIYRGDNDRRILSTLYWTNLVAGLGLFLIVVLATPWISRLYGEPRVQGILLIAALSLLVTPIGQQFRILLQREFLFKALSIMEIASRTAGLATALATAALLDQGAYSIVWGQLTSAGMQAAGLLAIGIRQWPPALHFDRRDLRGYVRFGLFQLGERGLNQASRDLDKFLIGILLNADLLGVYQVASQIMRAPYRLLSPIVARVSVSAFAKIRLDDEKLRRGYVEVTRIVSLVTLPTYVGIGVLADPLTRTFLGPSWGAAGPVLATLVPLGALYSIGNLFGGLLIAKGRADIGFYVNALRLALYAPAIWFGARYGVQGVAWALCLVTGLILFPIGIRVRRWLIGQPASEFLRAFSTSLPAALVMGLAVSIVDDLWLRSASPLLRIVFGIPVGVLVYSSIAWWREKELLRTYFHSFSFKRY